MRTWQEGVASRIAAAGPSLRLVRGQARFVGDRTIELAGERHRAPVVVLMALFTSSISPGATVVVSSLALGQAQPPVTAARSPAEAAAGAELAITMLATPDAVEEVLFDREGPRRRSGASSSRYRRSGRRRSSRSPRVSPNTTVDAPVRGSVPEATAGKIEVFVGSHEPVYLPRSTSGRNA